MTLKLISHELCKRLKESESAKNNLFENDKLFEFAYIFSENYLKSLNLNPITKSKEKSVECRKNGNEKFGKKLSWEALEWYNRSIAFAPQNSEELAFGYGNRATCLLSLGFSQEACQSIETAINLKISDDYKNKLIARKLKCGKKNKSSWFFGSGNILPLSESVSSQFESCSELVGFSENQYFERHLIAKGDVKTGEVLIVEKPYCSVLLPSHYYSHCAHCFKRCLNLIPCWSCSSAMFCSENCRNSALHNYHNIECSILGILVDLKAERMELLALRTLIKFSTEDKNLEKPSRQKNQNIYESSDFYNIYNLVTNTSKRAMSDLLFRSTVSLVLVVLLEKFTSFFSGSSKEKKMCSGGLILRFLQSLPCNAHEISEFNQNGLDEVGAGVYATLSLINHSCDPNVVRYSCQDVVVLRAIRPLKKGEQIFDNYGYHYATHSLEERQKALMAQYYFKCECDPCKQGWSVYENLPDIEVVSKKEMNMEFYQQLTKKFEENLAKIFKGDFDSKIIEENMRYLDFLDEHVKRPWKNYNKCQEAIKHCLSFLGNHFRSSKGV